MPKNTKMVGQSNGAKPRVKDRIFEAASELFYKKGIFSVGIDAIVSEANTNKMSLYRNFESKDELITEYIKSCNNAHKEAWDEIINHHSNSPVDAIIDIFLLLLSKSADSCDGCPTANVAIELRGHNHPALSIIFQSREEARARFFELLTSAGVNNPNQLADTLILLFEGCVMTKFTFSDDAWPGHNVIEIVKSILSAEIDGAHISGK